MRVACVSERGFQGVKWRLKLRVELAGESERGRRPGERAKKLCLSRRHANGRRRRWCCDCVQYMRAPGAWASNRGARARNLLGRSFRLVALCCTANGLRGSPRPCTSICPRPGEAPDHRSPHCRSTARPKPQSHRRWFVARLHVAALVESSKDTPRRSGVVANRPSDQRGCGHLIHTTTTILYHTDGRPSSAREQYCTPEPGSPCCNASARRTASSLLLREHVRLHARTSTPPGSDSAQ